jgi:hypothetical protein
MELSLYHPDTNIAKISPPYLPIELLRKIANNLRDDDGERRYNDFNSLLQVNRTLYDYHNRMLWKNAGEQVVSTRRMLTHFSTPTTSRVSDFSWS